MGYTQFTKDKIELITERFEVNSVIDLGAQNDFAQPKLPAPYISEWYDKKGIAYTCIDLNGENGACVIDLSEPVEGIWNSYGLVVDAGTSEHVGDDGKFTWEAIYNCWVTKHTLLDMGGIMYSENPKTGNWPGHGFNYYTQDFYNKLAEISGYELLDLGEHPACNNITDGWNVFCTMRKVSNHFPTLAEFKKLSIFKA